MAKPQAKSSPLLREIVRNRVAYAYIAPFYILFILFGLFPIVAGLYISFFRWDGLSAMRFQGFGNYINLFGDALFWKALYNTAYIGIIAHIPILLGGLILAYILNNRIIKGENIFKTVYFMPMVTSSVAVSIIFQNMFGFNFGLINYVLERFGIPPVGWLVGNGEYMKIAIIVMFSWKWIGWNMVIYLAGMQGIGQEIYEAATIDGASHVQTLTRITIPLLKPIIVFTVIQSTIGTLNLFTEPFVLAGNLKGGPNNQGLTAMMYLLNKAPQGNNQYGYASAVAYVITLLIMVVSMVLMRATSDDREKKGGRCHG